MSHTTDQIDHTVMDKQAYVLEDLPKLRLGTVFCSPDCSHPYGGRGFALLMPNQSIRWFRFDDMEVEDWFDVVATAMATTWPY